jgi:RNA polymerase sigma-70 factor (ECF subfamily)
VGGVGDDGGADVAGRTDAELVAAHAAGDPDAFGEVVRRNRDRLWAVALRTLGDREEAADAVQDALVSAFRSGRSGSAAFRGESAVTTWLHRIVVNACLDRVRRASVRSADPLPEHDLPAGGDPVGSRETALDVTAALAQIPAEQRAALVLVDMYGWTVEDAAEVLDCATGTVKSRCARGRARLRPLLVTTEPAPVSHPGQADPGADRGRLPAAGNPAPGDRVPPLSSTTTTTATTTAEGGERG